ncbi:MAG: cupin domain-containing protein [Saprospiraceae bacterium]
MKYNLPYTIENGLGEKIIFSEIIHEADGDRVITEGICAPKGGPVMHVHYMQDEGFAVVQGSMVYQIHGQEPVHLSKGQTATFFRNEPHRFWNDGNEPLHIKGWIKPVNSIIFFLSALYAAQKKSGSGRPEIFDAAYLTVRYKNEYGTYAIPAFAQKVILPVVYIIGKLLGKYEKFKDAPVPL